jgi:iron complex outermembrane receptor protein
VISNQGSVDISGIEGDVQWRVNRILDLAATFADNRTKVTASNCYTCFLITGSASINGKRLTGAPEYTVSFAADLHSRLTETYEWFYHADDAYRGNIWIDQVNLLGTGASNRVGMEGGLRSKQLSLSLFIENLTDNRTITGATPGLDFTTFSNYGVRVGLPEPRTYGGRLKYRF